MSTDTIASLSYLPGLDPRLHLAKIMFMELPLILLLLHYDDDDHNDDDGDDDDDSLID